MESNKRKAGTILGCASVLSWIERKTHCYENDYCVWQEEGIAPGLQSKIERLWHGHLDRRESFSLILVDPQPTSAVPNGQVHLIIDLWPSLQALLYYLNGMLMMSRDVHCSRTACKLRFLSMKFFWRIPSRRFGGWNEGPVL